MTAITVIGSWHNAIVTAAGLAELGHHVTLANHDGRNDPLRLPEPGLEESIAASGDRFKRDILRDTRGVVWLAIDTPLDGQGGPAVETLIAALDRCHEADLIIIGSQVPVGFCERVSADAYVPENLRFGKGLEIWRKPDRLVIGAQSADVHSAVAEILKGIPVAPFFCSLPTAEMIKHATNAFLATSISFANEIARVCAKVGANAELVERGLRLDSRIANAPIRPGAPFSGGTLQRDVRALQRAGVSTPLLDAVLAVNEGML